MTASFTLGKKFPMPVLGSLIITPSSPGFIMPSVNPVRTACHHFFCHILQSIFDIYYLFGTQDLRHNTSRPIPFSFDRRREVKQLHSLARWSSIMIHLIFFIDSIGSIQVCFCQSLPLPLYFQITLMTMLLSIPEMHKHLEQLNRFYSQRTSSFISAISAHPGKFTHSDAQQFSELIEDIRNDALKRISVYFNNKFATKSELYDSEITNYTDAGESLQEQLVQFREGLEDATLQLKKEQNRRQGLLQSFSEKYSQHLLMKKVWRCFLQNKQERQRAKALDKQMDEVYRKNLLKKAFFPWRTLTYKEGYEQTVRRETERDIQSIHEQYQSIIDILKNKIRQTDDMVKVKRAAKGEFAFALSKNLLKTISNLSLEVMSLNQMSLRDGEADEHETRKFMKTVDNVIGDKLAQVRQYKQALLGGEEPEEGEKRKKKITFV